MGLVAIGLGLGACGSGSAQMSATDSAFVQQVQAEAPDISTYRTPVQLTRMGHAVCDGFSSGASYEELADRVSTLEGSDALSSEDLGAVMDSAVQTLCPQFRNRVN